MINNNPETIFGCSGIRFGKRENVDQIQALFYCHRQRTSESAYSYSHTLVNLWCKVQQANKKLGLHRRLIDHVVEGLKGRNLKRELNKFFIMISVFL